LHEFAGAKCTDGQVAFFNQFLINQNDLFVYHIQNSYCYFGKSQVVAIGYLWDLLASWAIATPQIVNGIFLDNTKVSLTRDIINRFTALGIKVRQLLVEWSKQNRNTFTYTYIDYLKVPLIREIYILCSRPDKSNDLIVNDYEYALSKIEEFVQVIFYLMVEDAKPHLLERLPSDYWINAWAVGLDESKWEANGLFTPSSEPRNLDDMFGQIRGIFEFKANTVKQKSSAYLV
jgi:hypothetical protein